MRYTVRNEDGELSFESIAHLQEAWQAGLIAADDRVQKVGEVSWETASAMPMLKMLRKKRSPVEGETVVTVVFSLLLGVTALYFAYRRWTWATIGTVMFFSMFATRLATRYWRKR